ncbi:MAG TPA: MarR family transcriptional regulator [Anaerolineae bacterium]|nr:MarR family transcriptional regulator [Anaerolineae bacterium]
MVSRREHLYNLLKETFLLLDDGDRRLFSQYNLSAPRYYALVHILEEPGISSSGLSERLICDKSNVTRIVRGLEKQGYLYRKPHETDGRTQRLYLTEKGQTICLEIQNSHHAYNDARLMEIDETTRDNLLHTLSQLHDSLQASLASDNIPQNGNSSQ